VRERGLVKLDNRKLTIPDMAMLQTTGEFSPTYLHRARLSRHTDARRAS